MFFKVNHLPFLHSLIQVLIKVKFLEHHGHIEMNFMKKLNEQQNRIEANYHFPGR